MKLATTLLVLLTTIPTALSVPVALDQVQPDSVSDFPATVYSSTDIPSSFPTDSVLDNDDGLDFIQATNENLASSYISPEDYHRIIAAMNNTETDGEDMFSAQGFNNPLYREYDGSLFQVFRHNDGNSENDEVCNTMSAPYMPYTGFRFITTAKVSVLFFRKKTSSLVYCYQGKEIARASKKPSFGDRDIVWGAPYCFKYEDTIKGLIRGGPSVEGCYVPARMVTTFNTETIMGVSWRRPERLYGGLFRYPGNGYNKLSNEAAIPVAPLMSDEPYMGYAETVGRMTTKFTVPIAYTPDYYGQSYPMVSDSWSKYIDINEEYKPLVATTWPFTKDGEFDWMIALKELIKSEALWEQLKTIYQEMPWNPEIGELVADVIKGKADAEDLINAGISKDLIRTEAYGPLHFGFLQQRASDPSIGEWAADIAFDIAGAEFRLVVNQLKTRMVLIENKRFARFMYMMISRLLAPN